MNVQRKLHQSMEGAQEMEKLKLKYIDNTQLSIAELDNISNILS
jgi:hypothetical protein